MPRRTYTRRTPRTRRRKPKAKRKTKGRRTYRRRRKFTDNTISVVLPNLNSEQAYFTPIAEKVDSLTSTIQYSDTQSRDGAFSYISGNAVALPAYENYASTFRYSRIKWLKITLIPEKWMAVTLTDQASGAEDGEKPRIHWINDNGDFALWQSANNVSVQEAETFGNRLYKSRQFTKTMSFYVKPYYRLGTAGSTYNSFARWTPNYSTLPLFTTNTNLWFGFSNVPTGWKYKTIISACIAFKDPYTEYVPPPLALEEKKDEEPTSEEIQAAQDLLASVKLS